MKFMGTKTFIGIKNTGRVTEKSVIITYFYFLFIPFKMSEKRLNYTMKLMSRKIDMI